MFDSPIFEAIKGGALLGIATSISYVVIGRIVGMSGLLATLITFRFDNDYKHKLALLGGMLVSSSVAYGYLGMKQKFVSSQEDSALVYFISGFLVGLGTRLGGGCTSGHGLCGLPRFSLRSITAVFLFLTTGIITASLHLKENIPQSSPLDGLASISFDADTSTKVVFVVGALLFAYSLIPSGSSSLVYPIVNFIVGAIFSAGLLVSGMTKREKVNGFLDISEASKGNWDMSLFAVLMTGVGINLISFNYALYKGSSILPQSIAQSLTGDQIQNPKGAVDLRLVIGAVLFGIGWGIGSMCPGPVIALLPIFQVKVHGIWLFSCFAGMYIAGFINTYAAKAKTS